MDPSRHALVAQRAVCLEVKMLHAGLETQGALLQLTQLLVAHGHVVEDLKCNKLISVAVGEVDNV